MKRHLHIMFINDPFHLHTRIAMPFCFASNQANLVYIWGSIIIFNPIRLWQFGFNLVVFVFIQTHIIKWISYVCIKYVLERQTEIQSFMHSKTLTTYIIPFYYNLSIRTSAFYTHKFFVLYLAVVAVVRRWQWNIL